MKNLKIPKELHKFLEDGEQVCITLNPLSAIILITTLQHALNCGVESDQPVGQLAHKIIKDLSGYLLRITGDNKHAKNFLSKFENIRYC